MGLPIVVALAGLAAGFLGIFIATNFFDIATFTPVIAAMIGLGVGIDYSLFIVTRFREGLHKGASIEESVARAMDTAGRAVLFAGIVVVIAILGSDRRRASVHDGLCRRRWPGRRILPSPSRSRSCPHCSGLPVTGLTSGASSASSRPRRMPARPLARASAAVSSRSHCCIAAAFGGVSPVPGRTSFHDQPGLHRCRRTTPNRPIRARPTISSPPVSDPASIIPFLVAIEGDGPLDQNQLNTWPMPSARNRMSSRWPPVPQRNRRCGRHLDRADVSIQGRFRRSTLCITCATTRCLR